MYLKVSSFPSAMLKLANAFAMFFVIVATSLCSFKFFPYVFLFLTSSNCRESFQSFVSMFVFNIMVRENHLCDTNSFSLLRLYSIVWLLFFF